MFCYLANVTLFSGCLAIHGRRVYSWRHTFTCRVTKSIAELKKDGRSACFAVLCGGSPPQRERDDESLCEIIPRKLLPKMIKNSVVSIVIILLFLGYLSASIYGIIHLKQGLILQNLVLDSSYYHRFLTLTDEYFPTKIPIGFIADRKLNYAGNDGTLFLNLLSQARNDSGIESSFERCWLKSYESSTWYNSTSPQDFVSSLQIFLNNTPDFQADVVFDGAKTNSLNSDCALHVRRHWGGKKTAFSHSCIVQKCFNSDSTGQYHHHLSLNRESRWGTTDDFTTSFLHFSLFSTALLV